MNLNILAPATEYTEVRSITEPLPAAFDNPACLLRWHINSDKQFTIGTTVQVKIGAAVVSVEKTESVNKRFAVRVDGSKPVYFKHAKQTLAWINQLEIIEAGRNRTVETQKTAAKSAAGAMKRSKQVSTGMEAENRAEIGDLKTRTLTIWRPLLLPKFGAIVVDPPWQYAVWGVNGKGRSAENHYPIMTLDRLKMLPIYDLLQDDGALFLWTSPPYFEQAVALGKAWGLTYTTRAFLWSKTNKEHSSAWFTKPMSDDVWHIGMGHYTRANPEDVWLFTKQKKPKRKSRAVRELIVAPMGRHSEKPERVQDEIERLVDGPYCELFARRQRPGWTCLGNEIDGLDIFDAITGLRHLSPKVTAIETLPLFAAGEVSR